MFFGHEVKTGNVNKTSPMTLEADVKLSQAVLDPAGKGGNKKEPVCLMAEVEGKSFILAVLDPSQSWQCPLDLVLAAGSAVKFYLRGQGTVHLTGYEIRDDMGDDLEMSMSSSDDEEFVEEPVVQQKARTPQQAKNIPVKAKNNISNNIGNNKSPATSGKQAVAKTNGKPAVGANVNDSDDESSDDEDFDVDDVDSDDDDEDDEDLSDDENLSFGEMGSSDDDDMADMDDEDDDDDDDDDDN